MKHYIARCAEGCGRELTEDDFEEVFGNISCLKCGFTISKEKFEKYCKYDLSNEPYLKKTKTILVLEYNPEYGDNRMCVCGHPYYRHFDTYEDMKPVGCKYCSCNVFVEKKQNKLL